MALVHPLSQARHIALRLIGLGGMARIDEIRTDATPHGTIIRNEGIREEKARGRADLINATQAIKPGILAYLHFRVSTDAQKGMVALRARTVEAATLPGWTPRTRPLEASSSGYRLPRSCGDAWGESSRRAAGAPAEAS